MIRVATLAIPILAGIQATTAGARSATSLERLLAAHNAERARVGAPPLRWDMRLAQAAGSYGPVLARLGRLQHSPKASRPGQRENLWMGTRGAFSPEQMVGTWISERRYFRPGVFPNVSSTGNWYHVGHYSQLVWRTTTHVGCAIYSSRTTDYLICRYSPPGNIDGRLVP
ncbi:SCP-like extracellular [Sphingomonas piscis]|uniref:SCP-like extracellular n=1 Tax=Sphingomonas piscis TaxID=2714943 RepID=A0A6G7YSD0_9SPHN|nr:CAP domain-containing protein [Sphingomonas piscis]QIK79642.1 SCP-like extracellular [Sphingomonas piscis]